MGHEAAEFDLTIDEDTDFFVRAQVVDEDGNLLTQSDVTSNDGGIVLDIYHVDSDTPTTLVYTADLNKVNVIFDTPIAWGKDETGANFEHQVKTTDLAAYSTPLVLKGGNRYRVIYKVQTTGGAGIGNIYIKGYAKIQGLY